jgi:lipopolysaccharide heptosyltransferase II
VRILVIRLRLVGDVVFTTPVVRALRRAWPDAHLAYLVEEAAAPIVDQNPHLNEVIVIGRERGLARLWADLRIGTRLRRARFDVVLDLHGGPRAALLTWLSRAHRRIGYSGQGRSWAYTEEVHRPVELRPRHSVVNQWDILAPLRPGLPPPDPRTDAVEMAEAPEAAARMQAWMAREGLLGPHVPIVIHVSAGNAFRRWPLESFVELAVRLSSSSLDRRIILTSGPSEADAADRVAREALARLPGRPDAVRTCGDTTLAELRALTARAALYIGGDSGPLHMAATTRTPIVGLYGPTLPVRSAPWRDPAMVTESVEVEGLPCRPCDQRVCAPGDFRCLTQISVDAVAGAAERALAQAASSADKRG